MSTKGKEKALQLAKEILEISYPLCKRVPNDRSNEFANINKKAYELLKLMEHNELE